MTNEDLREQKIYILQKFTKLMMCEYMLDYVIWCFVKNQKKIDHIVDNTDEDDLEDHEQYQ